MFSIADNGDFVSTVQRAGDGNGPLASGHISPDGLRHTYATIAMNNHGESA